MNMDKIVTKYASLSDPKKSTSFNVDFLSLDLNLTTLEKNTTI